jgi:probable phosphoglycerate mutase
MHTELYLVRHGETLWNLEKRFQGQIDSPLTENGREQARILGEFLQGVSFDVLITSDLGRAEETARLVNSFLKISAFTTEPLLRERNFGIFHGLNREEAEKKYPQEAAMIWSGNSDAAVPGGESKNQLRQRVQQFLDELPVKYPGKRILAVTHGGVVNTAIRLVLRIPFEAPRRFKLPNTGLSIFVYEENEWFLRAMNVICPLNNRHIYDDTV